MIRAARFPISSVIHCPANFLEAGRQGEMVVPVRYGLLEHEKWGPVLIDTGYTSRLLAAPGKLLKAYRWALDPELRPHLEPTAVLAARGYRPQEVEHVIVTHLHADHICGLADFPNATFHLPRASLEAWQGPRWWHDNSHGIFRTLLPETPKRLVAMEDAPGMVVDFQAQPAFDIFGDGSVGMVPLGGHLDGHAGVVFKCDGRRVFYAADAAWTRHGYRQNTLPPAPMRWVVENSKQALQSGQTVLAAERNGWEVLLCHDPETTRWDMSR